MNRIVTLVLLLASLSGVVAQSTTPVCIVLTDARQQPLYDALGSGGAVNIVLKSR